MREEWVRCPVCGQQAQLIGEWGWLGRHPAPEGRGPRCWAAGLTLEGARVQLRGEELPRLMQLMTALDLRLMTIEAMIRVVVGPGGPTLEEIERARKDLETIRARWIVWLQGRPEPEGDAG